MQNCNLFNSGNVPSSAVLLNINLYVFSLVILKNATKKEIDGTYGILLNNNWC